MEERFQRLTNLLLERNKQLSAEQARTWVEGMWEDFEATRAKAGRPYRGQELTEQIVINWIRQYGPHLHRYVPEKGKFAHLNEAARPKH